MVAALRFFKIHFEFHVVTSLFFWLGLGTEKSCKGGEKIMFWLEKYTGFLSPLLQLEISFFFTVFLGLFMALFTGQLRAMAGNGDDKEEG